MNQYPWLFPYFEKIVSGYRLGKAHHALLIQSYPGMGVEKLVYSIAKFLMCRKQKKQSHCGECRGCQLMKAGTHPDFYVIKKEKNKILLGINVIREVIEKLYEHAQLSDIKIVWLNNISLLTEEAANALLKILEDPPQNTWFFLCCRDPKQILITLRSRCSVCNLRVPKEYFTLEWLNSKLKISKEKAITAIRLYSGVPTSALIFLNEKYSQREKLYELLKISIKKSDWLSLLSILNQNQVIEYLYWISSLFLDSLKIRYGKILIRNLDNLILIKSLSKIISRKCLLAILQDLSNCSNYLLKIKGVNRELILINYLLHIENLLEKDQLNFSLSLMKNNF